MATATWPAGLPDDVLARYVEQPGNRLLRTPMDHPAAKRRPRFTAVPRPFRVTIELTRDQVQVFDDFFNETLAGGVMPFDWVHPRTRAAVEFRFVEEPEYRHQLGELWYIPLALEILP